MINKKIRQYNKFIIFIILSIILSLLLAIATRLSIKKITYADIKEINNKFQYQPYEDLLQTNDSFVELSLENNIDVFEISNYIIKGIASGERELLDGVILVEIKVLQSFKGDIKENTIYIYEPVNINYRRNKYIGTFEGYNLIKDGKEYIFCLNDLKENPNHNYSQTEENRYIYTNPSIGKFEMNFNADSYPIYENQNAYKQPQSMYRDYINSEQVFKNNKEKENYISIRKNLFNKIGVDS